MITFSNYVKAESLEEAAMVHGIDINELMAKIAEV